MSLYREFEFFSHYYKDVLLYYLSIKVGKSSTKPFQKPSQLSGNDWFVEVVIEAGSWFIRQDHVELITWTDLFFCNKCWK
jgi:hypothetical protein